jgi:prepilin-type N-terminal cleavage/methylation domain-containing protein
MTRAAPRDERGFTLVELLVAITILGIIMGAIGAMIATAFRTSTTVSAQLNGSRGPKVVSRYWVPDVEEADRVEPGAGGCGSGNPVVTFTSTSFGSNIDTPDQPAAAGQTRTITWAEGRRGARDQLTRYTCLGGTLQDTTIVVAELQGVPSVDGPTSGSRKSTIHVSVPDTASTTRTPFTFDVSATGQVTPAAAP